MALTKCRDCGQSISKRATACPGCGAPVKHKTSAGCGCLVICLFTAFCVYLVNEAVKRQDIPVNEFKQDANVPSGLPKKSKPPAISQTGECVIRRGVLASPSEELLDKALRYVIEDDEAALIKLMNTGQVIELKVGMRAHLVKSTFTGKIKIRPHGQTIELWTVIEAIEEKD